MKISTYTGGFVQTNGYLIETPDGNLLIDAPEGIAEWAAHRGVRVDDVLLTHQHYDHVTDAAALKSLGARLHAFEDYSPELTLEDTVRSWGMPISVSLSDRQSFRDDRAVAHRWSRNFTRPRSGALAGQCDIPSSRSRRGVLG